jgi:hypothetical protein
MGPLSAPIYEPRPRAFHARFKRSRAGTLGQRFRRKHRGRRALVLLAAVAVPALAAPGPWNLRQSFEIGQAGQAQLVLEPMPFEKSGDSFPGSAFYYLSPDEQFAGAFVPYSVPGTVGVPGTDLGASSAPGEVGTSPAAKALRVIGSMSDQARAEQCLTQAVYYEAASEPDAGQRAVAQVVLNRVMHTAYPNTVCGVVFQGSERNTGCQFSFTCDGALNRVPSRFFWDRARNVARAALAGYVYAPVGLATHYHTIAVHPYWAPSLKYLGTIGAHRFYSFNGRAGTPGAYRLAYVGNEPLPAPHPHSSIPDSANPNDPALDPVRLQQAYEQGLRTAQAQGGAVAPTTEGVAPVKPAPAPKYAPELQARGGEALYRGENLPTPSNVRPEYQDSGKWIAQPGG